MPHPKHRKPATRKRILAAAARLFAERGFEATSIEDVMRACGLTRGGFYLHFRSKAELHAEALPVTAPLHDPLDTLVQAARAEASPWDRLALDVASTTPEVRRAYAGLLAQVCERLGPTMAGAHDGDAAARAVAAMLVGALAVARTVDDPAVRQRMAEACRQAADTLRSAPAQDFFWSAPDHDLTRPAVH